MVRTTQGHDLGTLPRLGVGGGGTRGRVYKALVSHLPIGMASAFRGILMRAGLGMTALSGEGQRLRCSVVWCAWSVTSRPASPPQPSPPFLKSKFSSSVIPSQEVWLTHALSHRKGSTATAE